MARLTLLVLAALAASLSLAHAAFFACPAPCEAMLLPRDMESLDDCLCRNGGSSEQALRRDSTFRCPPNSAAIVSHPLSFSDCTCLAGNTRDDVHRTCASERFRCLGRYKLKPGVAAARSVADCACQHPYTKDDATGQCVLRECPRAGNYVEKPRRRSGGVTSLADCACVVPLVKNDQTGVCAPSTPPTQAYECPPHAVVAAGIAQPTSFHDCYCDWGFVATPAATCVAESASYICPRNAVKRSDVPVGSHARGFFDCECLPPSDGDDDDGRAARMYVRSEAQQTCDEVDVATGAIHSSAASNKNQPFTCPTFSTPRAAVAYSVEQCECLAGYGWQTPAMRCVRMSTYACPLHAYKATADDKPVEESFSDCACASGYYRDDMLQRCVEWFLANDNGCPAFAVLTHWPLQSKANCACVFGVRTPDDDAEAAALPSSVSAVGADASTTAAIVTNSNKPTSPCRASPSVTMDGKLTFSECPANGLATTWPISSWLDCTCRFGFGVAPMSDEDVRHGDGELFQCTAEPDVDVDELALACRAPMVVNKLTGACRLPLEEVVPRAATGTGDNTALREGSVLFKGIEYDYVLTDDNIMVTQGDVAIGELLAWDVASHSIDGNANGFDDGVVDTSQSTLHSAHVLHGYYNAERDHRWRDATMCYEIDASARRFGAMVRDAMAQITALTGFVFRECSGIGSNGGRNGGLCRDDPPCAHDYVSVRSTPSSCFSFIGRIGGAQTLGVSSDCGHGNVLHVLLHAVGLHHTIDRPDRDDHVRIAWECIAEAKRSNFVIEDVERDDDDVDRMESVAVPYDFFSIMHHPADAFVHAPVVASGSVAFPPSKTPPAWCQSLFPRITDFDERLDVLGRMGQRERLAVTDIHAVWRLYPALQAQNKAATLSSTNATAVVTATQTVRDDVFESRLHAPVDTLHDDNNDSDSERFNRTKRKRTSRFSQRAASFIGAIVTLGGFGAFVAFAAAEVRKRSLRDTDAFYAESLLTDRSLND